MKCFLKKSILLLLVLSVMLLFCACQDTQTKSENTSKPSEVTQKTNSGLLLGLSKDNEVGNKVDSLNRRTDDYRTLWVYNGDNGLTYIEKQGVIITPVGDSFMKLENQNFKNSKQIPNAKDTVDFNLHNYENYYNFNSIISYKANEKAKILLTMGSFKKKYLHEEEGYLGEAYKASTEWLLYVGNNYASIKNYFYFTGGGSFSASSDSIKMYNIINLSNLEEREKSAKLIDLLDSGAKDIINDLQVKYNKTLPSSNVRVEEEQYISTDKLTLKRVNGKWTVQVPLCIKYYHDGNGSSGDYIKEFIDTDIKVSESLTSYDTLSVDWDTIIKKIPDAKDAVSSPNKDMLAVLMPTQLLIFSNPQAGLDKPSLTITVDKDESIILNQWGVNEYVSKWTELIKSY